MITIYDENVGGNVYMEPDFPRIRYFMDYGIYELWMNGSKYEFAVIGGAYSVDKYFRLETGRKWFEDEQLTKIERINCMSALMGKKFSFILSHTAPLRWEPTDLFLNGIDQSKVDKSMEKFLDEIVTVCPTNVYIFGHYHADRIERPGVEQMFTDIENLQDIIDRWSYYKKTNELPWYLIKSPNFYMDKGVYEE